MKDIFWAPNYNWWVKKGKLIINGNVFPGEAAELFPRFYEFCAKGTTEEKLLEKFADQDSVFVKRFLKDLKDCGAVISDIQSPADLFYGQSSVFRQGEHANDFFFMQKENVENYRYEQGFRIVTGTKEECFKNIDEESGVPRRKQDVPEKTIRLMKEEPQGFYIKRRSVRKFDQSALSFETLSRFLEIICVRNERNDSSRVPAEYAYPSAGGLYPLDFYLMVKGGRVESVPEGLYRLDPVQRKLFLINGIIPGDGTFQYALNREIFQQSAFSVYIFFRAEVSMPKYQDMAYYYAILDAGFASAYLEIQAYELGLGTCSIGDMRFSKIEKLFKLERGQKHLHTIEVGKRMGSAENM